MLICGPKSARKAESAAATTDGTFHTTTERARLKSEVFCVLRNEASIGVIELCLGMHNLSTSALPLTAKLHEQLPFCPIFSEN